MSEQRVSDERLDAMEIGGIYGKWNEDAIDLSHDLRICRARLKEELSKPKRSEQHADCVVILDSAWQAMGARLKELERDAEAATNGQLVLSAALDEAHAMVAALREALDKTHSALFYRCGGADPATDDERRILDLSIPLLGLFAHKSDTATVAAEYRNHIYREGQERGWERRGECMAGAFRANPPAFEPEPYPEAGQGG